VVEAQKMANLVNDDGCKFLLVLGQSPCAIDAIDHDLAL
jgi:hypothetical protein